MCGVQMSTLKNRIPELGRDEFDSLRISRDNLVALGYGDWFRS